jgi:drug/metabolite transporter (DMT)-like permease
MPIPADRVLSMGTLRTWLPGFALLSAIWGSSFALIKVAVDAGVPPAWVALWRCALGAAALWAILAVRRERLPRDLRAWGHAAVVAVLLNAVPFVLFAFGETRISSVRAGVWNATTPLFTMLSAVALLRAERLGPRQLGGLALGFGGVLVVLGVWRDPGSAQIIGSLACLAAAFCYGVGFAYTRRHLTALPHSVTALAALQITCGTAELALVVPALCGPPRWPGAGAAAALLALGAVGTGVAYILNLQLVRTAGPTVASTVTYAIPLWSTTLGALLLAEPVGAHTVIGGLLVITAVALVRAPAAATAPPDGPPSPTPRRPPPCSRRRSSGSRG